MELQLLLTICIAVGVLILILFWLQKNNKTHKASRSLNTLDTIVELLEKVNKLEKDIIEKRIIIEQNDAKYSALLQKVKEIEINNHDLEIYLHRTRHAADSDRQQFMGGNELLLITSDQYTQQKDEIALTKAGISYRRIADATLDRVEQELRRSRQQRRVYKYVMISGHANESGFVMSDEIIMDSYWMNQNFVGVKILFLNGCKSTQIADDLIRIVDCVISLLEPIPQKVAQSFAESFWYMIASGSSCQESFDYALSIEPTIRSYADIRITNK